MPDNELTVRVTADTGNAATSIGDLDARLVRLEQAFNAATAATKVHGETHVATAAAVKSDTGAIGALAAGLREIEGHSIVAARALQVFHLEAEAGAVKVGALAEVLEGLGKAALPLLAIGAAIAVVTVGFAFLKDSVKEASEMQTQMRRISTAVEDNGESWDHAREKVEAFLSSEARFTGFSQGELRSAFNTIIEAGHSTADAYQIMTVAEDTARARGMDVEEVTQRIIQAEAGRALGLAQLDPRLKDAIKNHADLDTILTQLANDMRGQAEGATNDFGTSVGRLNVAWGEFKEDVGTWLLPWLTDVVKDLTHLVDTLHNVTTAIGDATGAGDRAKAYKDAQRGVLTQDDFTSNLPLHDGYDVFGPLGWTTRAIVNLGGADHKAHANENQARYIAEQRRKSIHAHGIHLDRDPTVGNSKGGGSEFDPSYTDAKVKSDDRTVKSQHVLDAALKSRKDAERDAAEAVKLAVTAQDEYNAKLAEAKLKTDDAVKSVADLTHQRTAEENEIRSLTAAQTAQKVALDQASAAQHAFGEAHKGSALSKGETAEWRDLSRNVTETKKAYDATTSTLRTVTNEYHKNGEAIRQAKVDTQALAAFEADFERQKQADAVKNSDLVTSAYGTYKQGAEAEAKYWQDKVAAAVRGGAAMTKEYIAAQDAQTAIEVRGIQQRRDLQIQQIDIRDQEAMYAKSLSEQVAYLQERLAYLKQFGEQYAGQEFAIQQKIATLQEQEYQKRIDDAKAALDKIQAYETSFIDNVLLKHLSLRDAFKSVFNGILADYLKTLEQMALAPDGILGKSNPALLKMFGMDGGATADPVAAARNAAETKATAITTARTAVEDRATQATTGAATALDRLTTAAQHAASAVGSGHGGGGGGLDSIFGAFNASTGSGVNVSPGAIAAGNATGPSFDPLAGFNMGNLTPADVNVSSVGGTAIPGGAALPTDTKSIGGSTSAAKAFGGAMQGLMIAQMVNGITGGNSTWGSVGGAVGGAFFGPVGAAVGAAIGGQFGPHWGPASNYPDRAPDGGASYGQFGADWQGSNGFGSNGTNYNAQAQYNYSMGGQGLDKTMEQWANSAAATTDSQKALQKQIIALEGGNPNADLGVKNLHNGVWTLDNGSTISVADAQAMAAAYQANVGTNPMASSVFQLTRTMPDMNIGHLSPNGTYVQTPINVTPTTPTGGAPGSGSSWSPPGSSGDPSASRYTINGPLVQIQGSALGTPEQLAATIAPAVSKAFRQIDDGMQPGSPRSWGNATRSRV